MDAAELKRLLVSVPRLTQTQKAKLLAALEAGGDDEAVRALLESRLTQQRACPHCHGSWIVRNGSINGVRSCLLPDSPSRSLGLSVSRVSRLISREEARQRRGDEG